MSQDVDTSAVVFTSSASCRAGIQQKMVAAKQAHKDVERTKPWHASKQSYLIDAAITELVSGHEILYAPHSCLDFPSCVCCRSHRMTPQFGRLRLLQALSCQQQDRKNIKHAAITKLQSNEQASSAKLSLHVATESPLTTATATVQHPVQTWNVCLVLPGTVSLLMQ